MRSNLLCALVGLFSTLSIVSAAAVAKFDKRDATYDPKYTPLSDTADNCIWWWNSDDGLSCELVLLVVGIKEDDFRSWNPSITSGCGNYKASKSYCIKVDKSAPPATSTIASSTATTSSGITTTANPGNGIETPSPLQDGIPDNCSDFYFVKPKTSCSTVLKETGLTLAQLSKWNNVGDDCTGLWAEVYVCVAVLGGSPTHPPTATTTSGAGNGITTPMPTQPGMVDNCAKFHFVEKNQGCDAITKKYSISVSDLAKWNDIGGTACSGLWASVNVCVGILGGGSSPTQPGNGIETPSPVRDNMVGNCNSFHFVNQNENCETISKKYDFPVSKFYEWNPDSGSSCSSLWRNTYVCVGTTTYKPTPTKPGNGIQTPSPIQDGMTKNCKTFHFLQKNENCETLAKKYNTSVSNIIKWNGSARAQCSGLWAQTYACVAVL